MLIPTCMVILSHIDVIQTTPYQDLVPGMCKSKLLGPKHSPLVVIDILYIKYSLMNIFQ